ncbi:MAG: hypothetical protein DRI48_03440 [Chloroflexi bacterium]|nr:MAG: hypothetical protein DRI48_03440 [Chloroflexota bacterium]
MRVSAPISSCSLVPRKWIRANLKIPRAWRDHVPLLVAGDEIVWVCGRRLGEGVAVGPGTRRVARLRFERMAPDRRI